MAGLVFRDVLLSLTAFAVALGLVAVVIRAQVRRYNRTIATDLLDDWRTRLELLDADERRKALADPPPNVVAAMVALPSPSLRSGWNEGPGRP
jgi:hypothetical protein